MLHKRKSKQSLSIDVSIKPLIRVIRGQKVILDADLARIYGVTTKRLNEQVRRNRDRFPEDFMFRLTAAECQNLKSQIATSKFNNVASDMRSQFATASKRNVRYLPHAFTEHGAVMAANVLNSPAAVRMSIFVVRAFLRMREMLASKKDLARELALLEEKLTERLDIHESAIVDVLKRIMRLIDPPPVHPLPPKRPIGFHVKQD